ncbi:MAG: ferritin-like domain-containing protein [Polyangiaceae bacterium]
MIIAPDWATFVRRISRAAAWAGPIASLAACGDKPAADHAENTSTATTQSSTTQSSTATPEKTTTPATASTQSAASSSSSASASATTRAPSRATCNGVKATEQCFTPFSEMHSSGNTPGPRKPFKHAFDANGCAPVNEVSDGCCVPAAGGPRFDGKQCCYDFCGGSCCGRPLVVEGAPVVFDATERADWASSLDASSSADAAIASAWLDDARMEHASVASFAKFTLDLTWLGAPPDLLREAARAMSDEIGHAELCFSVARRYGAPACGPAHATESPAIERSTPLEVVRRTVLDGCVGETLAAAYACAQLEATTDPEVARALAVISEEELRHAELAFRFVAWARENIAGASEVAARAFAEALERMPIPTPEPDQASRDAWRAAGRLDRATAWAVAASVRDALVAPRETLS